MMFIKSPEPTAVGARSLHTLCNLTTKVGITT